MLPCPKGLHMKRFDGTLIETYDRLVLAEGPAQADTAGELPRPGRGSQGQFAVRHGTVRIAGVDDLQNRDRLLVHLHGHEVPGEPLAEERVLAVVLGQVGENQEALGPPLAAEEEVAAFEIEQRPDGGPLAGRAVDTHPPAGGGGEQGGQARDVGVRGGPRRPFVCVAQEEPVRLRRGLRGSLREREGKDSGPVPPGPPVSFPTCGKAAGACRRSRRAHGSPC